ncbi:MAG: hypothetical protein WC468_02525 [Candidatus Paceibacterota bacterium]
MRALKKKAAIIIVAVIAFAVTFFRFFKHRELEMALAQAQLLEKLLPWGYTMNYAPSGIAIVENFWDAVFVSSLVAVELGILAFLIIGLLELHGIIKK